MARSRAFVVASVAAWIAAAGCVSSENPTNDGGASSDAGIDATLPGFDASANDSGGANDAGSANDSNTPTDAGGGSDTAIDGGTGNTLDGAVDGTTMVIADFFVYDESYDFSTGHPHVLNAMKFTSYTSGCAIQQANDSHHASSQYLKVIFGHDGTQPLTTGTYTVGTLNELIALDGGDRAVGQFKTFDGVCGIVETDAIAGSFVVTDLSNGAKGSYSLQFPNGDALSGDFDVPLCAVTAPSAAGTCVQ